jgi:predicted nucleic acid-binding protein
VILVDTSVWVDHLRERDKWLSDRLDAGTVLSHPFVIGEIALGRISQRDPILSALRDLPQTQVATAEEVLQLIERRRLFGLGIGYVGVHLLAAVSLTAGTRLWTRDRRLHGVAERLGLAAAMPSPTTSSPPMC